MKQQFFIGLNVGKKEMVINATTNIDCLPPDINCYIGSVTSTISEIKRNAPLFLKEFNQLNTTNIERVKFNFNQ
uniref:Uncharacterized protein n=1 Tax=viral metagenome TaxID=1070528 RepID=A0A6M3J0G7_9ZZZZ